MTGIRSFFAIDLPERITRRLEKVSKQLQDGLDDVPARWVPAENMHLTLKFLGDVSETNLEVLKDVLRTVVTNHEKFEMSIGGLGAFPKAQRPRVIWIGIEAPPELSSIQRNLESETARLGYARERRPFSPHLTLARVSRNASARHVQQVAQALNSFKVGFLGVARVEAIHLYRSDLHSGGAVYTNQYSVQLNR